MIHVNFILQSLKLYRPTSALTGSPNRDLNTSKRTLFFFFTICRALHCVLHFCVFRCLLTPFSGTFNPTTVPLQNIKFLGALYSSLLKISGIFFFYKYATSCNIKVFLLKHITSKRLKVHSQDHRLVLLYSYTLLQMHRCAVVKQVEG